MTSWCARQIMWMSLAALNWATTSLPNKYPAPLGLTPQPVVSGNKGGSVSQMKIWFYHQRHLHKLENSSAVCESKYIVAIVHFIVYNKQGQQKVHEKNSYYSSSYYYYYYTLHKKGCKPKMELNKNETSCRLITLSGHWTCGVITTQLFTICTFSSFQTVYGPMIDQCVVFPHFPKTLRTSHFYEILGESEMMVKWISSLWPYDSCI